MSDKTELVEVECCHCHRRFNKTLHRYKEAKKYNWNFFCSSQCMGGFRNKTLNLKCSECSKEIVVARSVYDTSASKRFFCSTNCSAKLNNKLRGARSQETKDRIVNGLAKYYSDAGITFAKHIIKPCLICGKPFKSTPIKQYCCSRKCSNVYQFGSSPYTKDDVVNIIINIGHNTGKTPQKRDCARKLEAAAIKFFGTWNKAMTACNLKPNSSKFQKIRLKCLDGHISDSISEKIIDDWLFTNGIRHEKSKKYPNSNMNCDFYFTDYNLWVEYFGLYGSGNSDYIETMKLKEKLVKKNKLNFMSLKPDDLYKNKKISYDNKLKNIFGKYVSSKST